MSKNALPPSLVGCYHKDKRHINSALGAIVMSVLPAKADLLPLGPIARACGPRGCSRRPALKTDDNTIFIRRYGKGLRCSCGQLRNCGPARSQRRRSKNDLGGISLPKAATTGPRPG